MIDFTFTITPGKIGALYRARGVKFRAGVVGAIRIGTTEVHQRVSQGIRKGGDYLGRRTGTLARALFSKLPSGGGANADPIGYVGFNLQKAKYARIQEMGGTVRATKSKFLTIPIRDALTPNGVARFTARELISNPVQFGYSGTFFHRGMIFGRHPGVGKQVRMGLASSLAVPLFVLKKSVTIKKSEPLHRALHEKRARIVELIQQARKAAV